MPPLAQHNGMGTVSFSVSVSVSVSVAVSLEHLKLQTTSNLIQICASEDTISHATSLWMSRWLGNKPATGAERCLVIWQPLRIKQKRTLYIALSPVSFTCKFRRSEKLNLTMVVSPTCCLFCYVDVPTEHRDSPRWKRTVLKHLSRLKDGIRWFKTVLCHLKPALCFMVAQWHEKNCWCNSKKLLVQ